MGWAAWARWITDDGLLPYSRDPAQPIEITHFPDRHFWHHEGYGKAERLETLLKPEQWRALVRLNVRLGTDTMEPIPGYGDLETLGYGTDNAMMRQAAAATPLRPMPLAVLAHGRPFAVPEKLEGFSSNTLESALRAANANLATLVPNARFFVAKDSGHDIHQDQPELVIEAIRQMVAAVRHPDTWYDLTSCCAK